MGKPGKTQAIRLLESQRIPHRVTVYDDSGEFHTGEEAAALVGAPAERVYKTLVVLREAGKPLLVIVQVGREVDLRVLAKAVGEKSLRMASQKEAERLTGMQVGGISALALPPGTRKFEVVIDEKAREIELIHVSAGARGIDVELAVADLVRVTGARFVAASGG